MRRRSFLATPLLLPSLTGTAAAATAVDYPAAKAGIELVFPRDHGAHPDFRTEWWYVTGALDAPQPDVGFQFTFFRSRPGIAESLRSPIAARQIVFAHAALTIPGEGLLHAERAARANLGARFASHDLDVGIGAWRMFRQEIGGRESLQLRMQGPQFSWELSLNPSQPLLLQGDAGHSRKGHTPDLASHYVSWPQLRVAGTLLRQGRRHAVDGRAWFDHEWSTTLLGGGAVGWDWLGINLGDGGALMAFRMRDAAGSTLYAHAAWRDADGRLQQFASEQVHFTPLRHWQSPRNGARYPVEIEVRFGEHSIRTRPVVDDQELSTTLPTPVSYWEGLVRVEGSLSGRGYLEMTGYAGRLRVGGAAGHRLPA